MYRTLRKATAVATCAALALIAPTVIPAPIGATASTIYVGCGVTQSPYLTFGSANAVPAPSAPCVGAPSAIAPSYVMLGVGSVMTNAAYVWNAQCRELTPREAITSTLMPVIGWLFNDNASQCKH